MPHDPLILALLFFAGIGAGIVNAIAGGATFFTFPAMLASGLPPVIANASNAFAIAPGHFLAAFAMRKTLPSMNKKLMTQLLIAVFGGALGGFLLIKGGNRVFEPLIPFLMAGTTLIFAFAPLIRARIEQIAKNAGPTLGVSILPLVTIYGGYFGAGMGVMLLSLLSIAGYKDLREANALKNLLASFVNISKLIYFISISVIAWPQTLLMLCGASIGGFIGGRLAQTLPQGVIRKAVILTGACLSLYYFYVFYLR